MPTKTNEREQHRPTLEKKPRNHDVRPEDLGSNQQPPADVQPEFVSPPLRRPEQVGGPIPVPADYDEGRDEPVPED